MIIFQPGAREVKSETASPKRLVAKANHKKSSQTNCLAS